MNRRKVLMGLTSMGALGLMGAPWRALAAEERGKMKIAAVEFFRVSGRFTAVSGQSGQHNLKPIYIYDDQRPRPYKESPTVTEREVGTSALYLSIKTDSGVEGLYGPIDTEAAVVVDMQLRRFLIGKDPLAGDVLWDMMYRSNRHSRAGHFMMAISAVDNALWDLRGRYFKAPVYQLLGGPSRKQVEAYGSCLGSSVELVPAARRTREVLEMGFRHQKWFLAYGPGSGAEGMQKNVDLVRVLRETLGDKVELMFDAFMGWDLQYAIDWAKQVEQYRPRWIEEAFPPDRMESFAELSRKTTIPVATGEHFYARWEVQRFLNANAIKVVQADPEWCGGVSELAKICTLASVYDAHVIPHGHSLHAALHVVASQPPITCPLVEYLINKMEHYHHFEKNPLVPVDGKITLSDRPGFGIELDDAKVEKREKASWA